MERINYSQLIQNILKNHLENHLETETEVQLVCDTLNHHYQVLHLGWHGSKRVYGCIIHVDIKDDKIWIQRDHTEIGIANELEEAGVSKNQIVLAFQSPYKRQFSGYAVS